MAFFRAAAVVEQRYPSEVAQWKEVPMPADTSKYVWAVFADKALQPTVSWWARRLAFRFRPRRGV